MRSPQKLSLFSNTPQTVSILTILALTLLRFFPFLMNKTLFYGDNYSLLVPGKLFTAYWIRHGVLPLWNPMLFAGLSWIGDINQSILYPTTLFFTWFHPATALNLTIMLHIFISAVGMYLLARHWSHHRWASVLAACMWAFSPQITGSINNLSTIQSMTWMPWVVWAGLLLPVNPRGKFLLVLVGALQIVGGYPQHVIYSFGAAIGLGMWYHRAQLRSWKDGFMLLARWIFPVIAIVGVTAVSWMSFVPQLQESTRVTQSNTQAQLGSLHPAEMLKIIHPYLFDHPTHGIKWGPTWNKAPNVFLYVTWVGLFIICWNFLKKRTSDDLFFAAVCVVTLLIALGGYVPGYDQLLSAFPFLRVGRGPSIVLMIPALILPLWIAVGWKRFQLSRRLYLVAVVTSLAVGAVSLLIWLIAQFAFPFFWKTADTILDSRLSASAFHTMERDRVIAGNASSSLTVIALLACLSLVLWKKKKYGLFALVVGVDMIINTQGVLFFAPHQVYPDWETIEREYALVQSLPVVQYRFLTRNYNDPYTDFGAFWEALNVRPPLTDSYVDGQELREYNHLQRLRRTYTPDWNMPVGLPVIHGFTTLIPQEVSRRWNKEGDNSINNLNPIELDHALLSRWAVGYYLVDPWFPQTKDVTYPEYSKTTLWQIYELPSLSRFRYEDSEPVEIASYTHTPNMIEITFINDSAKKELIVADRFEEGWRAFVNEEPVETQEFEGMRKIPVVEGQNVVRQEYAPLTWRYGLALTIASAVFILAWWHFDSRRSGSRSVTRTRA